jgi:hypothetical protein
LSVLTTTTADLNIPEAYAAPHVAVEAAYGETGQWFGSAVPAPSSRAAAVAIWRK